MASSVVQARRAATQAPELGRGAQRHLAAVNKELWLLLSLFLIAAALNSLVGSHRMLLGVYTLPTLFSAYSYGRRHATMTALASVFLVVLVTYFNPTLFTHRVFEVGDQKWFDITVWGGILVVTAYAMGTLYERNQTNLRDLRESYDGILLILQHFASNDKYSQDHAYRVSVCATKIAECLGMNSARMEDVRTAALLQNVEKLGISKDILYKAANLTQEQIQEGKHAGARQAMGGSLRRVIPILLAQQAIQAGASAMGDNVPLEVRVLRVADVYESLTSGLSSGKRMSPTQAEEIIIKGSGTEFDPRVVDAFVKAFQHRVGKGAEVPV